MKCRECGGQVTASQQIDWTVTDEGKLIAPSFTNEAFCAECDANYTSEIEFPIMQVWED